MLIAFVPAVHQFIDIPMKDTDLVNVYRRSSNESNDVY
jgi:hypothetical protein